MTRKKATGQGAIANRADRIKALRGIREVGGAGTDALLRERRREREREERKAEDRGRGRP
jgi:hypothetical protein